MNLLHEKQATSNYIDSFLLELAIELTLVLYTSSSGLWRHYVNFKIVNIYPLYKLFKETGNEGVVVLVLVSYNQ